MNLSIVKGNMTRDPELKEAGEAFVAEFGVAVNRRVKKGDEWEEQPEFIDMKCWGARGEALVNHFSKGMPILVKGEFRTGRWEKDGEKRSKSYIHVNDWEFCSPKSE